jgi:hypothetical protein
MRPYFLPYVIQMHARGIILRHTNGMGEIQNRMPPSMGYKYGFTGGLREFITSKILILLFMAP